ncbi:MAG TPA: GNAT family N-acetyltransferase [Candidatus Acidoferrales bacterium]|nr:GNAT family N-acetyltransferase [Candidatus Acidoferrales bacterium]
MRARIARMGDAAAVHRVIAHYAGEGLLLPRTEAEIREHISRFLVLVEKRNGEEKVLGCVALEPYGADLAEVRSLAVAPDARGQGRNVGDRLMKAAMDTARRRKIARLFAVTHRPDFFSRYGFVPGPRQAVPEKVQRDCVGCPKERKCTLVATVAVICPEREVLPVLNGSRKELSVA